MAAVEEESVVLGYIISTTNVTVRTYKVCDKKLIVWPGT